MSSVRFQAPCGLAIVLPGRGHTAAGLDQDAQVAQSHLSTGEPLEQHQVADAAQVADPEHLAGDLGEANAERQDYTKGH